MLSTEFSPCDGFDCTSELPPHDRIAGNISFGEVFETFASGKGPGAELARLHLRQLSREERPCPVKPLPIFFPHLSPSRARLPFTLRRAMKPERTARTLPPSCWAKRAMPQRPIPTRRAFPISIHRRRATCRILRAIPT